MGKRFEKRSSLQERWDQRERERNERWLGKSGVVFTMTAEPPDPPEAVKVSPLLMENGVYAVTYDYVDPPGRSVYVAPPPKIVPPTREKSNYELVAEAWGTLTRLAPTEAMAAFIVQAVNEVTTRINLEAAKLRQPKPAEQPAPKSEQVARGRRYFKLDD